MLSLFTGLVAGAVHVFSGPDHLAAIAPLAADDRRGAWLTGFRWGLGHAGGVILVGCCSLLFRELLPLDLISSGSERLVGVVLIGIGLWGLRRAFDRRLHVHEHHHGAVRHVHVHAHRPDESHSAAAGTAHSHAHAAFAVGTLHGLAGSSHFLGVLPALAFPTNAEAVSYLLCYGVGTILAMCCFSSLIGWLAGGFAAGNVRVHRTLLGVCSMAAMLVGGYWLMG